MIIKRILFILFLTGVVSTIAGFYIMRDSVKDITFYKDGVEIAKASGKDLKEIQKEIKAYANSGHKAFDGFTKQEDIYKMRESGNGIEVTYKKKTPSFIYMPLDKNGRIAYIVYAGSNGIYLDQPAWTSELSLKILQEMADNTFVK